ncbi:MAG TPA: DNA primase [Candidatus Saccharimonadales bacterium]|nr:DNA primase [Candidatus Saccharimonadales bacterium]
MDAKDEIKNRLSIEDVIGEYVQLRRAGRSYKGLSPFNPERTPSFVVSPDKQIWHDFSSGKGGDMFSFVMEVEGVDFRGALELLARRAGIDLDQYKQAGSGNSGPSGKTKERLYEALEWAAKFYQAQFARSQVALEYVLKKRQFTKATALEWQLGYSPNNGRALVDFLKSKGFSQNEIQLAGLTNQRGGDMFRGRLQIPLCDANGRVIGFTARLLADDPQAPKYINTPATPLYDKSRHVFGLHLAKEAIRKSKFVVLAEGNLDVIQSHQASVRQVVATAGTALTEPHLKTLSRLTGDIRLSFDADRAGIAATERAIPVAAKVGVQLSIITIPSGKDPDELIKQDVKIWADIITRPQYAVDWLIERYAAQLDLATVQGKKELSDVVLRVVRQLPDSVEQDHYIGRLAELLSVNKEALNTKLAKVEDSSQPVRRRVMSQPAQPMDKETVERKRVEDNLMALVFLQPKLRTYAYPLEPAMFMSEPARGLFVFLQEHPDFDGSDVDGVQKFAEYAKILSLVYETLYQDLELVELGYEAARLQAKLIAQYVRTEKQLLSQQLQTAESAEAETLLRRVARLDELLRTLNQGGTLRGSQEERR